MNKKNTYVIGDIHGAYKALIQCIERSEFDINKDQLICLGDVADSWPEVPECFDFLLTIKYLDYVIGNHDDWLLSWFKTRYAPHIWISQGGKATLESYQQLLNMMEFDRMDRHQKLLEKAQLYYIDENNNFYVHGGFDWHKKIPSEYNSKHKLMWDRHLWQTVTYWENKKIDNIIKKYNKVFIGHTSTSKLDPTLNPVKKKNVWNLDQGAGWEGKLTIMNVETEEYWQSDIVKTLYPNYRNRK